MEKFSIRSGLLFLYFLCLFYSGFSQTGKKELSPGYYVVVAAYAETKEDAALRYVGILQGKGHTADYGFNSSRHLYFVYLKFFTDLKTSIRDMLSTRKKGEFTDAWVRVVPGDIIVTSPVEEKETPAQNQAPAQPVSTAEEKTDTVSQENLPAVQEEPVAEEEEEEIVQHDPMTLGNTEVFLSLFNATNNRIIDGEIDIIDSERTRLIRKVKGNEYMILPDPKNQSGKITLIAEVFGYRKVQHEMNYKTPLADTAKSYMDLMGTTFVVYFDMVRYHKGDIATLYNVYFYNDAAIMLPESKYELNELLLLMKDNPKYKIRLHGHTNGNYHGKIVSMGPSKAFFSIAEDSRQGIGTAKELSQQRAEVIREYLMTNGVSGDRIEIKAWGGKRPVYDRNSVNAKKNVRVEVEILEE